MASHALANRVGWPSLPAFYKYRGRIKELMGILEEERRLFLGF
jgi:hypothetical protein